MDVEIKVGRNGFDSEVRIGDKDVSSFVRRVEILIDTEQVPYIRLDILPRSMKITGTEPGTLEVMSTLWDELEELRELKKAKEQPEKTDGLD